MLIKKTVISEANGMSYIDSFFDSSNILQTSYFPQGERLYISFGRGQTYSYGNIDEKLYLEFENAESQGKFFNEKIKRNPDKYPYRKEFSLYPREIEEVRKIILEEKNKKENDESL